MYRPMVYTNRNYWNDPFEMMNSLIPAFFGDEELGRKSVGFSTDVIEKDDSYVLEAELPGFEKEEISVDLKNDVMTISASHKEEEKTEDNDTKYIRRERRSTSFFRSFKVENVTPADIKASYNNGILEIVVPKKDALPEKKAEAIEIM